MIRHLYLSTLCLYAFLSCAEETTETHGSNISNWRDLGKKSLDSLKQASGTAKQFSLASYRFASNNYYAGDFYCNTNTQLTGHKFIDGTACQITYNFLAKNEYSGVKLEGSFLESQRIETCAEAEKICKQIRISVRESGNQLEILNHDKLIARIIYKNELPGFLPE